MKTKKVVIFDLDDTLYYEINYLKSAYREIAILLFNVQRIGSTEEDIFNEMLSIYKKGRNVFDEILTVYNIKNYKVSDLIKYYRNHQPNISLTCEVENVLTFLKESDVGMGLITDGRSVQQRAKIKALGLDKYLSHIVISGEFGSEKPNIENYKSCMKFFGDKENDFFYVGDNVKKDFFSPKLLGWKSVCLKDKGCNIHPQNIKVENEYKPDFEIFSLNELKSIIQL